MKNVNFCASAWNEQQQIYTFFTLFLGDVVDLHFCCAAGMVVVVAVQAFLVVMVQSFHGGCTRSRGVGGGSKGSWPYGLNFCKTKPRMLEMMFYHQKNCRWIQSSQITIYMYIMFMQFCIKSKKHGKLNFLHVKVHGRHDMLKIPLFIFEFWVNLIQRVKKERGFFHKDLGHDTAVFPFL